MIFMNFLTRELAHQIDAHLFELYSLDQLMELAGLSVALAVNSSIPPNTRIDVLAGPGNNGGDALVAARHLKQFGHDLRIFYPKVKFPTLLAQLKDMDIPIADSIEIGDNYVIDGIFGFGFKGEVRGLWSPIIEQLKTAPNVCSIDVPSGWDVDSVQHSWSPKMLISLTLPKECAKTYKGIHWLGGRFLYPKIAAKFGVEVPIYKDNELITRI